MTFLDTSAIYALADAADPNHERACHSFRRLLPTGFLTHNYVILESVALIQSRLGLNPALLLARQAEKFVTIWVDASLQQEAVAMLKFVGRRQGATARYVGLELDHGGAARGMMVVCTSRSGSPVVPSV